ncbi:MAG: hypothetical protein QF450_01085 [Rhodospirillales bacterium]|jgi:hypothetical protein|nr:hypothetical protein [Rhodospirillales bacterium]HJO71943.1 hypothetical protein [Rhodospirillales bacterium]
MRRVVRMVVVVAGLVLGPPTWAKTVTKGGFPVCSNGAHIDGAIKAIETGGKAALKKFKGCKIWKAGLPLKHLKRLDGWFWGGTCKAKARSRNYNEWFVVWIACDNIVDKK